jgi:Ca2+/Na+ antiporter
MKTVLILFVMGVVAGTIDIIPMLKMKIDRYSTTSAFIFHLIAPFILFSVTVPLLVWVKGGAVYILLALPTIILVAKNDKKSVPIMIVTSLVFGTVIGLIQSALL